MTASLLDGFRERYGDARDAFRAAATAAGSEVRAWPVGAAGPDGEELTTDVAWFGPRDAERVLVLISGTHGLEGLAGSACHVNWLAEGGPTRLPAGVAALVIHLINPYGVAWRQRGTEERVDLNRNFVDHEAPYRETALYNELHAAFMHPARSGPGRDDVIAAFRARHGDNGYGQAVFGGQYEHPDGMNFGGHAPTRANRNLVEIADAYLGDVKDVVLLDYHTGLGPYGFASLVTFCNPTDPLAVTARAWFGPTVMAVGGPEVIPVLGHTGHGLTVALPKARVSAFTAEFGTYDTETEYRVVVDDHWLQNHGDPESPEGRQIKADLVEYFYPARADWRELVAVRSRQLIGAAGRGLASSS